MKGGPFMVGGGTRRAVLLDRQPLWLEAVEGVLGKIGVSVVGKATSPDAALALVRKHEPELVITGIQMPNAEIDGIEFVRRARSVVADLRAIVLSAETDTDCIDRALDAGAAAYVVKSAHPDDLASAIRQAFELSIYFANTRVRTPNPALEFTPVAADLTRREREILRLVAEGHSNAALAKMLWVTEQTVKFHLSNVYRKLDVANRTEAARWAQRSGLLDEPFESAFPVASQHALAT